jgi:hypothetical protein
MRTAACWAGWLWPGGVPVEHLNKERKAMTSINDQAEQDGQPDDDPVEFIASNRSRGGVGSATCSVSVICDGEAVSVYLSDEIDARVGDWPGVKVEFGRSIASGKVKSIKLTKADGGVKIRRYKRQHVKVNVTAPAGTIARSSNGSGKQACDGVVDGDGNFVLIALPATISFEPAA